MKGIVIEKIGDRKIAIGGIGQLFFKEGFPISISVSELKKQGIEVSLYHVADECLKNGWSPKTTINKLIADFQDDIDGNDFDKEELEKFCFAAFIEQRHMIFKYLFGSKENASSWLKNKIQ